VALSEPVAIWPIYCSITASICSSVAVTFVVVPAIMTAISHTRRHKHQADHAEDQQSRNFRHFSTIELDFLLSLDKELEASEVWVKRNQFLYTKSAKWSSITKYTGSPMLEHTWEWKPPEKILGIFDVFCLFFVNLNIMRCRWVKQCNTESKKFRSVQKLLRKRWGCLDLVSSGQFSCEHGFFTHRRRRELTLVLKWRCFLRELFCPENLM
jgi:hypothetical protein